MENGSTTSSKKQNGWLFSKRKQLPLIDKTMETIKVRMARIARAATSTTFAMKWTGATVRQERQGIMR